jgi:pentose-5-phosphate-3-epimerase
MKIYLLHFNNYYNRQVKRFTTLSGYLPYVIGEPRTEMNFKPNDNVNTSLIQNNLDEYHLPDYLIAEDETTGSFTRWFVLECVRLRGGQYNLSLRRDLIAENLEETLRCPCYVEKATLNKEDPMIVNDEQFPVNQIKKREIALFDYTYSPWIVQYLPSDLRNKLTGPFIPPDNTVQLVTAEILTPFQYRYEQGEDYVYKNYFGVAVPENDPMFNVLLNENGKYYIKYFAHYYYLHKICVYIETKDEVTYLSLFENTIIGLPDNSPNITENGFIYYMKVGISIKPNTDVKVLDEYLKYLDNILIMSVEPGKGGQKFIESSLDKVRYLNDKKKEYNYVISIDGGINNETCKLAKKAGCDVVIVGTYLANNLNKKTMDDLK